MPSAPAPLYLDEDVSVVAGAVLRARGFEVVTTRDAGHLRKSDVEQMAFAAEWGRVLVTHNRVDFERLHREWLETGRPHAGIIVARRRQPGEIAARIGRLLIRLTADELRNQILYV